MAEVSIHKVVPGSILAKDVTLSGGAALLREGAELSDRQIEFLKKRGVATVFIEDEPGAAASSEVSDSEYAERCSRLDKMFDGVQDAPHMTAIRDAVRSRLRLRRSWD